MENLELSSAAARMLRELVAAERVGIRSGEISYGNCADTEDALASLDELEQLAGSPQQERVSSRG